MRCELELGGEKNEKQKSTKWNQAIKCAASIQTHSEQLVVFLPRSLFCFSC